MDAYTDLKTHVEQSTDTMVRRVILQLVLIKSLSSDLLVLIISIRIVALLDA